MESDQCMKLLLCKVDTGAEGNVISLSTYKLLFPESPCNDNGIPTNLSPSSTVISAFGGHPVDHYGTCVLKLAYQGSCKPYPFHVVDVDGPTILGLLACTHPNLVILNFGITTQSQARRPNLIVIQTQMPRMNCSGSMAIVFKALDVFKVNFISRLILLYPRSCILRTEFRKP